MHNTPLDKRLNACRPDLADCRLAGQVEAERFVDGRLYQVMDAVAPLRRYPRFDASLDTQLFYGELFRVFDDVEGWTWGQSERDGYVGYMPKDSLTDRINISTHKVIALRTFAYPAPDMKMPPLATLVLNGQIRVVEHSGKFVRTDAGYFIYAAHVAPIESSNEQDFVSVALRFAGTPYLWGGCSALGIDCSGLVQQSMLATGKKVLRDSDMQEATVGEFLSDQNDLSHLQRGDLLFWKGHVGIMVDRQNIIHANGYHMETVIEPVTEAISRIAAMYGDVTSFKRPC